MVEFFDQRRDFLQFYAMEEPRLAEARNRIIDGSRERGFNFFASLIEEGIRAGVFTRVDPRLATFTIQGAIRSLLLYYGAGRPVSELSRDLGNLMLRSLGADPSQSLKVSASAMIRTLVRRVIRLANPGRYYLRILFFRTHLLVAAGGSFDD